MINMRVHPKGLIVLSIFVAVFGLALDVRLGIVATVAATVVDWLYIGAPFWPLRRTHADHV